MREYYITYAGIIEKNFGNKLLEAIQKAIESKSVGKIVVLFSSLGGSVQAGFTIASIIRNSQIPIAVHATNNIDSIANVIYLSSKERTAESYAKFYMHGAKINGEFNEKALKEALLTVQTESTRIAYYVSENCNLSLDQVQKMMDDGTSITAKDALGYGIVHEITHMEIPKDALRDDIVCIN